MKTQERQVGTELLLSYIGMDMAYNQGKLMVITGEEDAVIGDVGTVDRPVQAQGVTIPATEPDPVLFSYLYDDGHQRSLRQLLVKLDTPTNPARFSVLIPSVSGSWVTQAADFTMTDGSDTLINPHGLAQDGNTLFLVDFSSSKIFIVDAGLLETAGTSVMVDSVVLEGELNPKPVYAGRGQAVIVLGDYLYALFMDADVNQIAFGTISYLFRLTLDRSNGLPKYDTHTTVGINAQSIIPVNDGSANQLLIPAIGGRQWYGGTTNGTNSNICYVPAVGAWPAPAITPAAPAKVTGDPVGTPITAYDIHAVGAALRDDESAIFILTQYYTGGSDVSPIESPNGAPWRIYRTTVGDFFNLSDNTTLSAAVSTGALTVVDQGTVTSNNGFDIPYGVYFWDILYEQVPDNQDDEADRVWVGLGSPILVTRAGDNELGDPGYGSPTGVFQNAYIQYGYLGGVNVNMGAFDLLIETQNQAKRGVSLKRTFRRTQVAPRPTEEAIAAAKAAQAKK